MNREERFEALAGAEGGLLVRLADLVMESQEVEIVSGPTVGLLMARVEEPSERVVFNFLELVVTEAEVTAGGRRGYAMVMGRSPEKALAGAVLDAAIEAGHPMSSEIEKILQDAAAAAKAGIKQRWDAVAPTRIRFEDVP